MFRVDRSYLVIPWSSALVSLWMLMVTAAGADARTGIVSLDLCSDWMLQHYAQVGQVKAYSPYIKQYYGPAPMARLTTHDGSLEQIIALRPAVVVSGEYNAPMLRRRLQQLDYDVRVLSHPATLDDVADYIREFKTVLGLLDATPKPVFTRAYPVHAGNGRTLLLLGANGIGTGRDTLEHDVLTAAGWQNYLSQGGFVGLQLERLVHRPPDAIYATAGHQRSIATQFAKHPALRESMTHQQGGKPADWRWSCPGPWTYELIEELAAWQKR